MQENKIGMRWRTQKEVFIGKGQFSCGNIACDAKEDLCSYEVCSRVCAFLVTWLPIAS
jgi:hypothetical protein